MSLANWINERNQLDAERARLITESKKKIDQINKRLDELDILSSNITRYGIDTMKVGIALDLVDIKGEIKETPERIKCVHRFRDRVAANDKRIYNQYFGVKIYSGFGEQGEDHAFGFGPKHGNIVFSIGLKYRANNELTEEQRDAIVYLTMVIFKLYEDASDE